MLLHTAHKCIEVGSQELELHIQFHFEKGEPYVQFQEIAEPPTVTIQSATATTLHNGYPRGESVPINLGAKTERELETWLLEHPERWE
jgi:hypothetical protein